MPSVPYIEYTNDQGIWADIYFPDSKQFVTFGPYAPRLDRCPRCTKPGFVVTNGTGICPVCRHMWDFPQPQPEPGTVAQIDIHPGDTP